MKIKRIRYQTDQNHPLIKEYRAAMERGMKSLHIMPEESKWLVSTPNPDDTAKSFDTLKAAKQYARECAKQQGSSVFVHDDDFRILERMDFATQ